MISLCVMTRRQLSWIRGFGWSMGMSDVKYLILRSPPAHHQEFMAQHARYFTPSVHGKTTRCWKRSTLSSQYTVGQPVTSLGVQRRDYNNSDFGSVTVCRYTESERSSGGSHNHLTADTPIFTEQTFPWSRWSHSVSACLFLVCVYTHTDTLVSSFYTESEICVYLEQRRFVNQTKINCQLLW